MCSTIVSTTGYIHSGPFAVVHIGVVCHLNTRWFYKKEKESTICCPTKYLMKRWGRRRHGRGRRYYMCNGFISVN